MKLLINKAFQVLSFSLSIFYIFFTAIGKHRIGIYEIRKGSLFNRSPDLRVFHDMESILCEHLVIFRRHSSVLEHILDFLRGDFSCNATLIFSNFKLLKTISKICNLSVLVAIDDYRVLEQLRFLSNDSGVCLIGVQHGNIWNVNGPQFSEFPFDYYSVWSNYFAKKHSNLVKAADCRYLSSKKFSVTNFSRAKVNISKEKLRLLIVDDDHHESNHFDEVGVNLIKEGWSVTIRKKLGNNSETFVEQIKGYDILIGSASTCLVEAPFYGALPVWLETECELASYFVPDQLAIPFKTFLAISKSNNRTEIYENFLSQLEKLHFDQDVKIATDRSIDNEIRQLIK